MITLPYKIKGYRPMIQPPVVPVLKRKGKSERPPYLEKAILLDTETSNNYDPKNGTGVGWIYQYAFRFAGFDCCGRRPSELVDDLLRAVRPSIDAAGGDAVCLVLIHNLSYDIQYLKQFLISKFPDFKILAVAPHKFITFTCGPFEFRCTYKLSNRGLAKWGKDLGIRHRKRVGTIDYKKRRYQDSELTKNDWLYMLYDVWSLEDCVDKQLSIYGDDLNSLPLTSTGYIRRDARKNYKKNIKRNRRFFARSKMNYEIYHALTKAMSGGLVHGNRLFEDVIVETDEVYKGPPRSEPILGIGHVDYRSEYPSEIAASDDVYGFPQDMFCKFWQWKPGLELKTFEAVDRLSRDHCVIIEVAFHNLEIKPGVTFPYAQSYKFLEGGIRDKDDPFHIEIEDNGRILKATGSACVFLTEWDLKWIRKQYTFDRYMIRTIWKSPRGPIPEYLRETVDENFIKKTLLKEHLKALKKNGAPESEIMEAEIDLMKSKNGLNGIYGMCATDPVRIDLVMDENGEWTAAEKNKEYIEAKLEEYYESWNNFMVYAVGVYVTALARNELLEAIEAIGYKYALYCDTDSIFFIENEWTMSKLEEINAWRRKRAEKIGAYVTLPDGEKFFYDVLERENEHITSFKFIHAKAYGYITDGGTEKEKLHCTIAGVSEYSPDYVPADPEKKKKQKGITRVQELGSLERLRHGTQFVKCGGTRCVYLEGYPRFETIDGHKTELAASAIICDVTKTLSGPIAKDEVWYIWEKMEDFR